MFQKFFRSIARKQTESELDNLISRFSSSDPEVIFILHGTIKAGPGAWRLLLTDDYAEFFDKMCNITNDSLDEESKKKIAIYSQAFIQLQKESREDSTIFCLWFWKVIFNTMLYSELDNKVRDLFKLIQRQSVSYHAEFIRRAEEAMGQKLEKSEWNEEGSLYYILPKYYK
jgi:hypothetical protein